MESVFILCLLIFSSMFFLEDLYLFVRLFVFVFVCIFICLVLYFYIVWFYICLWGGIIPTKKHNDDILHSVVCTLFVFCIFGCANILHMIFLLLHILCVSCKKKNFNGFALPRSGGYISIGGVSLIRFPNQSGNQTRMSLLIWAFC